MTLQVKLLAWLLSVALLLGGLYGVYHYGKHIQLLEDQQQQTEQLKKNQVILSSYAASLISAGEQHDKDQALINSNSTKRVFIHIPSTCPTGSPEATPISGASGVVPTTVDGEFAKFQDRVSNIIQRCDQLNIDAIRSNGEQ